VFDIVGEGTAGDCDCDCDGIVGDGAVAWNFNSLRFLLVEQTW
jgi:hypothetical protein